MTNNCPCGSDNTACYDCGNFSGFCSCGSTKRYCYQCCEDFIVQLPGMNWSQFNKPAKPSCACNPQKRYYCKTCGVVRGDTDLTWRPIGSNKTDSKADTKATTMTKKCGRHYHEPINIGTDAEPMIIHCSSRCNDRTETPAPDFGLYADYSWTPTWAAMIIDWPDYKIPRHYGTACEMIAYTYYRAKGGEDVEIGCIGGHGRTGTILACMKVFHEGGTDDAEAVATWVKDNYCSHAIETKDQKWFIAYFSNYWFSTPLPKRDAEKTSNLSSKGVSTFSSSNGNSSSTNSGWQVGTQCTIVDHFAMMIKGHTSCVTTKNCKWWANDADEFSDTEDSSAVMERARVMASSYPSHQKPRS
jgi:hypothetical protein